MTTPAAPQFSPDGQWWWDGTQWLPASQAPTAATPFAASPAQAAPTAATWGTPQPYGQPYGSPYGGQPPANDGKAVASLILGVLWLGGLGSIAAVVLGHLSRSEATKRGGKPGGVALAGLILGYVGVAGTALLLAVGLTFGVLFKDEIVSGVEAEFELTTAGLAEEDYFAANHRYTDVLEELRPFGYMPGDDVDVIVVSATATSFCLRTTTFGESTYYSHTSDGSVSEPCH